MPDFDTLLSNLSSSKALERSRALKEIGESKIPKDRAPEIVKAVIQKFEDASITVQRQAVKTLMSLSLETVPDELKVLYTTTEDGTLKMFARSAIRRIELERDRREKGAIELNTSGYVFSVSDFLVYINTILSGEEVFIKGEAGDISTFRENLTFFQLKDEYGVLNCWFPTAHKYHWNVELSSGIEVVVKVRPQVSPKSGRFGLRVLEMRLSGVGALAAAFKKLKTSLETEGLFDPARKRPLPFLPRAIGLITGENSAAYSDFIKVLRARMGGITIHFAPVRVQGVGSVKEICGAIKYMNQVLALDIIVLTRGGGSMEDLQSFNSEEVTRAVFSSRLPVLVAVGHEKDWSLAELASDKRASTPSNAAELVTPNREELLSDIYGFTRFIEHALSGILANKKRAAYTAVMRAGSHIAHRIEHGRQIIARLPIFADQYIRIIFERKEAVNRARSQCLLHTEKWYTLNRNRFLECYKLVRSYSPKNTLKRGYSIVKTKDKLLRSASEVAPGDEILVYPYEGVITGEVKDTMQKIPIVKS